MNDRNLGAPKLLFAPEIAYRQPEAFHSGYDSAPREISYRSYQFVGRMPVAGEDDTYVANARAAAREKYGPRVDVFRTARHWVVYRVV